MGQCVAAIVYGVPMTTAVSEGLREVDGDCDWRSEPPIEVETGCVSDFACLGLTIAVQNVPEGDEVEMPEGPISDLETILCAETTLAKDSRSSLGRSRIKSNSDALR